MSQQHRKWIELVKERIEKRGWSQTDLAIVVGVSPSAITQLFKDGKGSDDLKLRINKKLRISESWERFEEQEKMANLISEKGLKKFCTSCRDSYSDHYSIERQENRGDKSCNANC